MYLEMKDLSKSFDGKEVVSGLNLSMEQGEILCLLGASGCGKTTTLRMAGGFLTPDQGRIYLDAKLRNRMRDELKELQKKTGITMIFVTHDQEEAMALADKIAIMEGGRLIQMGAPRDVYQNPSSLFVMEFLGTADKAVMPDGSLLYFRPEDIRILGRKEELEAGEEAGQKTQAPASRKQLTGVISKSDYMGFYTQYFVETESGEILVREFEREYQPGEAVMLELQGGKAF